MTKQVGIGLRKSQSEPQSQVGGASCAVRSRALRSAANQYRSSPSPARGRFAASRTSSPPRPIQQTNLYILQFVRVLVDRERERAPEHQTAAKPPNGTCCGCCTFGSCNQGQRYSEFGWSCHRSRALAQVASPRGVAACSTTSAGFFWRVARHSASQRKARKSMRNW